MDKYLIKKPRIFTDSSSNSCSTPTSASTPTPSFVPSSIPIQYSCSSSIGGIVSDSRLRKRINEYDVNTRDQIHREYITKGLYQSMGHVFPKTVFGDKRRSFREEWYKKFDRLEYRMSKDAAYCFTCYLFRPANVIRFGDETFTRTRYKNWKRATEKFAEHVGETGSLHHNARILFEAFKNQRQILPHLLTSTTHEMEVAFKTRLTATLDVASILLKQGLPFRGHDESSTSLNRGNFLEFLEWYSIRNQEIAKVVTRNAPANNQMTSPYIQKHVRMILW